MEGGRESGPGRQSRLLGRLLSKLRGSDRASAASGRSVTSKPSSGYQSASGVTANFFNFRAEINTVEQPDSMSESIGCGSFTNEDQLPTVASNTGSTNASTGEPQLDDSQFAANIDLRYGGQYLSPDQLPEFCNQLHHLVEVIRNIHSYARITGEYPSELERRLEQEAREVASLAAEARNARDVVARARAQRRAVRAQRRQIVAHLASLKETEIRELESSIRLSDRKLFKTWETLKDSTDPAAFEPLLDEIRNKQTALENLVRLIESRRGTLTRAAAAPTPLPPPESHDTSDDLSSVPGSRKRFDTTRRAFKRKRGSSREPRSVPVSGEPSRHGPQSQDSESTSRYRVGSAGAVALAPLELPSRGSVRDILFFTVN
ncbi:uncharacterized protein isoform X2 [Choristoneura fumiferana]|uniref:uncharacterized protein isoform X2 n=1 Tax=Choristoneura fumiferana TaxID=7141 RepID=UPI003D15B489